MHNIIEMKLYIIHKGQDHVKFVFIMWADCCHITYNAHLNIRIFANDSFLHHNVSRNYWCRTSILSILYAVLDNNFSVSLTVPEILWSLALIKSNGVTLTSIVYHFENPWSVTCCLVQQLRKEPNSLLGFQNCTSDHVTKLTSWIGILNLSAQ
jgi:hypothetical protein